MTPFEKNRLFSELLNECTEIQLKDCKLMLTSDNRWVVKDMTHNVISEQFHTSVQAYRAVCDLRKGESMSSPSSLFGQE